MPLFVTLDVVLAFALLFLAMTIIPAATVKSIHRTKTWFSLLISCVVFCLSFFLLLGHQSGPKPPLWLCLISASLVYAGSPLIAAAGLILIVELYLRLTSTTSDINESRVTTMLWCLPVVHAVVFWVAMLSGLSDVRKVERGPTGFYCHVDHPAPSDLLCYPDYSNTIPTLFANTLSRRASFFLCRTHTTVHF
ncbi:uncharacterized protein EV420DRAFT_1522147 [Desarmillaria tabescens]|uniref:Uncharacterized protein n=1 Tax=Armillaria tabescens TaxID=1929756 RepID=A0AA39NCB6_ARMTA|nr:uncharacterized protein EV420DRAFT_1522147 [Desarmillaria tabescens]KAK0462995.1 hypothetical protein EV420DRAFT_1522147 [Desarmillaria tabescens]